MWVCPGFLLLETNGLRHYLANIRLVLYIVRISLTRRNLWGWARIKILFFQNYYRNKHVYSTQCCFGTAMMTLCDHLWNITIPEHNQRTDTVWPVLLWMRFLALTNEYSTPTGATCGLHIFNVHITILKIGPQFPIIREEYHNKDGSRVP